MNAIWKISCHIFYTAYKEGRFILLKEKGYSTYRIRKEKLIGQGTLTAIKNGTGGLDSKTIARLCETLDCQPADIMEYVKEPKEGV